MHAFFHISIHVVAYNALCHSFGNFIESLNPKVVYEPTVVAKKFCVICILLAVTKYKCNLLHKMSTKTLIVEGGMSLL